MLATQWQEEIAFLKQDLKDEIAKRASTSEMNVPNHICINNLKSKLTSLNKIEEILSIDKYTVVFIGTIGEGKTTAICHLFNLIGNFNVSKTVGVKIRHLTETQELLATGSGRTTICEVIIKAAEKTYIEIEPYTAAQIKSMILELCDSLSEQENIQGEQKQMISKELDTAIRNIINLQKISKTVTDGNKKQTVRIDKAKEAFETLGLEGLKELALLNANLESRTDTKIEFDNQGDERAWIKSTFAAINNAELEKFAIPKKIRVYVSENILSTPAQINGRPTTPQICCVPEDNPKWVCHLFQPSFLSGSNLSQFNSVVDTKGIDENPIRKDLQEYIDRQDTICLFATNFKDAPETNIRELMRYYLTSKSRDFNQKFVTFVIPHKGDPEKMNGGDGTWEMGTQIRKEDIQGTFRNLNLDFFSDNIVFYDALRCYNSNVVKLNTDIYSEEDVQIDRDDCIQALGDVVERRQHMLLKKVEAIKKSLGKIKNGETLTNREVEPIKIAVHQINNLRDLRQRIPSFVYDEFIDSYIYYYRNTYPAWNTKHAINRRFGIYNVKNIDIYYDAKIVAEGRSEDEMLKKFTKEAKHDLEIILNELKSANDALETFIPELIRQSDLFYDNFVEKVGSVIEEFLYEDKLSPQSVDSDFWIALINEKGKQRSKGETYIDNVCQTFKRELETEPNLNLFFRDITQFYWAELVSQILSFFGE